LGLLDRFLGLFSDVRGGEALTALLMLLNILLILTAYYVIKTIREPLILVEEGGAEAKSYAAAGQALVLMVFVPAYSWFSSRVDRMKLIVGVTLFFAINIELFSFAIGARVPHIGVAFFIWVGFFSLAIIAQFWSYANDVYTRDAGDRLFPIIGIGMTAGSPLGSKVAEILFARGVAPATMLHLSAALLLISLVLYTLVNARETRSASSGASSQKTLTGANGFALVFKSRYLTLIALLFILLNIVNTTGEYILSSLVRESALAQVAAQPGLELGNVIGQFYGNFFFWVNVSAVLLQAFLVSRLVKYLGLAGVLFMLPLVALGAYGIVAAGVGFAVVRWVKTAENSTDYSVMNTARQLIWLPTSRAEKYKAKQAVDTFFVRLGDVASAAVVWAGAEVLSLGVRSFALFNAGLVLIWLYVAWLILRLNRRLTAERETAES
jgi:AAA family ATP:ADP antiporter